MKGLLSLQKKFKQNPKFKLQYTNVLNEYIQLGHMSLITQEIPEGYYLSHHAVIKTSSNTTKTRVVFNPSIKPPNGFDSLNNSLVTGPTIQDNLFTI